MYCGFICCRTFDIKIVKLPDFIVGDRYQVFRRMAGLNIKVGDKAIFKKYEDEGRGLFEREVDKVIISIPLAYVVRLGSANKQPRS